MSVSVSQDVRAGDGALESVHLRIITTDADWLGTFDYIEVERSRGLSTGPFEALTAATWKSARLPEDGGDNISGPPAGPTLDIVGDALLLRVNEVDDYTVTFTDPGSGTLTQQEAADQITQAVPVLQAWVDQTARLVLETYEPGNGASLRVVGGDAAPKLGLSTTEPYSLAYGKVGRLALISGKEAYTFVDVLGSASYFYRTRFYGSTDNTASAYTNPQPAHQNTGLSQDSLVCGQVRLVRLNGDPLCGVQVRVFNRGGLFEAESMLVAGRELRQVTDADGVASFTLVRGMDVEVVVDGTSLIRNIHVPTDPADGVFNLLDSALGPDDYFKVRHSQIEYAYKRTL